MAKIPELPLDAPVAGQSLTTELGSKVWQQPPKYSTVDETLEYYMSKLNNPKIRVKMLNVLETGIPVTTVVDGLQMSGVMTGLHTIDVGILAAPVLMETIAYIAEDADIEYDMGLDVDDPDEIDPTAIALALRERRKKLMESPKARVEEEAAITEEGADQLEDVTQEVTTPDSADVSVENTGDLPAMSEEDVSSMPEEEMPAKTGLMARRV